MRTSAALIVLLSAACGPSFQAVYEGDKRFEHCYALDDNPNAPMPEKEHCWRDWMLNYTYGQTRDRVEYAAVRQHALSLVPALPTDEAIMEAAPGMSSKAGVAAPAPTSAFAPPPQTMAADAGVGTGVGTAMGNGPRPAPAPAASVVFVAPTPRGLEPPASSCQDDCSRGWDACKAKADPKDTKQEGCSKAYKTCMRACFK
jgi:hypothetical protein